MDKTMWLDEDLIDLPESLIRTQLDQEDLEGLARNMQIVGQLQAILVKIKGDRYLLIDGFRRLTATRMIKRKKINCTIKPENYQMENAAALIANMWHEDMPPLDEAKVVQSIVDEHGWGIPKTAKYLGKPESWVRGRLDINRLPPNIAERLQNNEIGMGVALELSRIPDPQTRDTFTEYAAESGCTLSQAQRWRETAERDDRTGVGLDPNLPPATPLSGDHPSHQNTECGMCGRSFRVDRVRILRACPVCYETIQMEADSGKDQQTQNQPNPDDTETNDIDAG